MQLPRLPAHSINLFGRDIPQWLILDGRRGLHMKKILLTFAISTFSLAIQASELSYSYVQVGYVTGYVTGDVENVDVHGFDFTASLAISDSFL